MAGTLLRIRATPGDRGLVVSVLAGEIDLSTAPDVVEHLRRLPEGAIPGVVIDASAVTFTDAFGLRTLIEGCDRLKEEGIPCRVVPSRVIGRLLNLLFIDGRLPLAESVEQARTEIYREWTRSNDASA